MKHQKAIDALKYAVKGMELQKMRIICGGPKEEGDCEECARAKASLDAAIKDVTGAVECLELDASIPEEVAQT